MIPAAAFDTDESRLPGMSTPAVGSPGTNKAFKDGTALTFPVLVDATHNQIEFDEAEYILAQYASRSKLCAITLPVVIDATHDQFEFNELEYLIPHGSYDSASKLAAAINASTNDEDNVGATFQSVVLVSAPDLNHLEFESLATTSLLAFGTGFENSALALLGLSDTDAMAAVGYPDIRTLCKALNASLQVADSSRLDAHIVASPSPFTLNAIRFTAAAAGVNVKALGTGGSNDLLASLGFSDTAALASGLTAIVTGVTTDADLTTDQVPPTGPKQTGNGLCATVKAQAAVILPLVITAATNDQFEFNELEYIIPAGTYTKLKQVSNAINAATNDEDNAGATFISVCVASPCGDGKLRFTAIASGANTNTLGTGAEHSALADLGVNDATALAGGS